VNQPNVRVSDPALPAKDSHPGEKVRAECTFAQSKEQGLGQAAEVDLRDRLLAREVAQFPMNDPPAREGRTTIAPGGEIDARCIRKLAFVHEPWREPCPYLAVGPRNRQQGSRLGMPLDSSDPGVTSP
jgi:hypothetical protein